MEKKIYIADLHAITPLGFTLEEQWNHLMQEETAIQEIQTKVTEKKIFAAAIADELLQKAFQKIATTNAPFTRLEKLMILALEPLIDQHGIHSKTGLIISTTKGNIEALSTHHLSEAMLSNLGAKLAQYFHFSTTPLLVSNACVSGIKAVSVAKRLMQMNQYENMYVVAADELTDFVISGFQSFQAMSDEPCQPFDADRKGISLGEAAAAVYLTTSKETALAEIVGDANTNDANHISGPSRTGEGLYLSIQSALKEASLQADAIDFLSAHGTATLYNDEMESIAFSRAALSHVPTHSLKGFFGHTLGASALLELVFLLESMRKQKQIVSKGFSKSGTSMALNLVQESKPLHATYVMKTASGFGGCNTVLILKNAIHG